MGTNIALLVIFVALSSVSAQTFQYSRGWTNGKRDGRKPDDVKEFSENLGRILSLCQMNKLKYLLEGKTLTDRLFTPCDYADEEETQPKRYKNDRNTDLFDAFK